MTPPTDRFVNRRKIAWRSWRVIVFGTPTILIALALIGGAPVITAAAPIILGVNGVLGFLILGYFAGATLNDLKELGA